MAYSGWQCLSFAAAKVQDYFFSTIVRSLLELAKLIRFFLQLQEETGSRCYGIRGSLRGGSKAVLSKAIPSVHVFLFNLMVWVCVCDTPRLLPSYYLS